MKKKWKKKNSILFDFNFRFRYFSRHSKSLFPELKQLLHSCSFAFIKCVSWATYATLVFVYVKGLSRALRVFGVKANQRFGKFAFFFLLANCPIQLIWETPFAKIIRGILYPKKTLNKRLLRGRELKSLKEKTGSEWTSPADRRKRRPEALNRKFNKS